MTVSTKHYVAVNLGTVANDGTGDDLRTAFNKVNQNFANYEAVGFPTGDISASGTIEADYFVGDASQLTNLPLGGLYSNANVASYLPIYSGNVADLTITGNLNVVNPLGNVYATNQLGYITGSGGTVTQGTNKANVVVLNKASGNIIMNSATLGSGANIGFRFQNSTIASSDILIVNIAKNATQGAYRVEVNAVAEGNANIRLYSVYGAGLSESIVLNYAVIKASSI